MMTREEYLKNMPSHFKLRETTSSADREAYLKSMPQNFRLRDTPSSVDQEATPSRDQSTVWENLKDLGLSKLALLEGGLEGGTLGFWDEAVAALASPVIGAYQWATDPNASFSLGTLGNAYSTAHDWLHEHHRELAQKYPWDYYGGLAVGTVLTPAKLGYLGHLAHGIPKAGATIPQLIALGGISGAVQGFGSGSGWENRLQGALRGGVVGAGLGGILGGIGGRLGAIGGNAPFTPNVTDIPTESFKRYGRELYEAGVPSKPEGLAEAVQEAGGEGGRIIGIQSGANKALEQAAKEHESVNKLFQNALDDVKLFEIQNVGKSLDTHLPAFNTIQPRFGRTSQDFVAEVNNRYMSPAIEIFEQLKYQYLDDAARKSLNEILTSKKAPDDVLKHFVQEYKLHKPDVFAEASTSGSDAAIRRAQYLDDGVSAVDLEVALATRQLPSNMRLDFALLHRFQNSLDNLAEQLSGSTGHKALKSVRDDIKNFINTQTTGNLYEAGGLGNRVAVSSYTDAMTAYRLAKSSQSAVASGRRAVNDSVEDMWKSYFKLNDPLEQEAYRVGMRQGLMERAMTSATPADEMNSLLQTSDMQTKLRTVFGDAALSKFTQDIAQQTRHRLSIPSVKYSGAPPAEKSLFRKIASAPLSVVGHLLDSLRNNQHNPKIMAEGLAKLSSLKPSDINNKQALELLQIYIRAAERGSIGREQFQRAFFELSKFLTKADVVRLQKSGITKRQAAEFRQQYGME